MSMTKIAEGDINATDLDSVSTIQTDSHFLFDNNFHCIMYRQQA